MSNSDQSNKNPKPNRNPSAQVPISEAQRLEGLRLFLLGRSQPEIATVLKCSTRTVRKIKKEDRWADQEAKIKSEKQRLIVSKVKEDLSNPKAADSAQTDVPGAYSEQVIRLLGRHDSVGVMPLPPTTRLVSRVFDGRYTVFTIGISSKATS